MTLMADLHIPTRDLDFGDEGMPGVHELLRELRAESPAWWVRCFGQPALLLLSYDLVHAAFADEATLPAATMHRATTELAMGRMVLSMMGEQHRVNRAIMSAPFRLRVVPKYLELIRETAEECVDEIAPLGEAELVSLFSKRFPLRLICRLLGLPRGRDEELSRWALALIRYPFEPEEALAAREHFSELLTPIIEDRRRSPTDDLISMVAHAEIEGERLSDEEIRSFVRLLFPAGADTTYLGMGNTLMALFDRPELLEIARTQPERRRAIVEEVLRWDAPVAILPRMSPADRAVDWQGIHLEPSTMLLFAIMAANRDPDVYRDADVLDPERVPERPPLTFGFGTHFCIGNHLALAEITIGLGTLLDRLPNLRLQEGANARVVGTVLRGPDHLPVRFDPTPAR
jgi:cytochrome P450